MPTETPSYVTLARIVRPQGRRGEVAATILTDFPEHLKALKSVYLWNGKSGEPRQVAVRACWISMSHGGQAVFHFEGSDSITDAEKFVGLQVQVPFSERVALPAGSYFVTDLIGCEIFLRDGQRVGVVGDVQSIGEGVAGTPLLIVDSARGELLIPLAEEICVKVDLDARRIEIVPPDGLLDLNES